MMYVDIPLYFTELKAPSQIGFPSQISILIAARTEVPPARKPITPDLVLLFALQEFTKPRSAIE